MPITLSELKERLQELLATAESTDSAVFSRKLTGLLQYSFDNYDQLDTDAQAYVDEVFERLRGMFQVVGEKLPEGPQKRRFLRLLGVAGGGKHFVAEGLMQILESPSVFKHPVVPAAKSVFTKLTQNTLDILFDATRHSHRGVANFAKVGLCYWVIDELLAALHLGQRAFANQSYAHIRTAVEILDLIELFDNHPDWANVWASGSDREVWKELKPSSVRKKLGGAKFDPMYSFLSGIGSHGTFRGLQARGVRITKKGEKAGEDRKSFRIWVGGTRQIQHIVWTNLLCAYMALKLLVKSCHSFAEYLNAEEIKQMLESSSK